MINKICVKCGARDASVEFKGDVAKAELIEMMGSSDKIYFSEPDKSKDDRLLLTCRCCGYAWFCETLDSVKG